MLLQADPPMHVDSHIYSLLLNASSPDLPQYTQAWESDLRHSISLMVWQKCFILTHKLFSHYDSRKGVYIGDKMVQMSSNYTTFQPVITKYLLVMSDLLRHHAPYLVGLPSCKEILPLNL